jgi:Tol biopolymer transport system component
VRGDLAVALIVVCGLSLPAAADGSAVEPASGLLAGLAQRGLGIGVLAAGPNTTRVSVASDGTEGNGSSYGSSISASGRYVAFESEATTLVVGDTNAQIDVFVRDRQTGDTTRVSVATDGTQGNGHSLYPAISADGGYVAFYSAASNLVSGDTNGVADVFVHDTQTGETTRASVATDGTQGNQESGRGCRLGISADGRYVAFESDADNLVAEDTNGAMDVFVRDRQANETTRVNVASDGTEANGSSQCDGMTPDGRYVAFESGANNLVAGDTNGNWDIFVRDRQTSQTTRVSVASDGTEADDDSQTSAISADGRHVAFQSGANNLAPDDPGDWGDDVFVHDCQTGTTVLVSVSTGGTPGDDYSGAPAISGDGRYIAFHSDAGNLVPGDVSRLRDVFVRDLQTSQTTLISVAADGTEAEEASWFPSISADGRYAAFETDAIDIVSGDTNDEMDVFVRDWMLLYQPDLVIRNRGAAAFGGNGVYNTTGAKQTARQTVAPGTRATYQLQVQADGRKADQFVVQGPKSGGVWRVTYFDRLTGGNDITAQVTGTGWQTPRLAPWGRQALRVEVKAKGTATAGTRRAVLVTATSLGDGTRKDAAQALTTVGSGGSGATVTRLAATPTRAGAQITLSLSAAATVEVRVVNLAGRSVRTLCREQACGAGMTTLVWDARADGGLRVPNGVYLVEVRARTADGTASRAVARLQIGR